MANDWERYEAALRRINEAPAARQQRLELEQQKIAAARVTAERAKDSADAAHQAVRTEVSGARNEVARCLARAGLPHALPAPRPASAPSAGAAELRAAIAATQDSVLKVRPAADEYLRAVERARNQPATSKTMGPLKIALLIAAALMVLGVFSTLL